MTVITTQAYLSLNHIPFRLIEENFACSRLRLMVRSAKVRKREHEIKREEDRHRPLFPDHALTFSRAFHSRAIPTI